MEILVEIIGGILLLSGAVIVVIGALGLLRMPDALTQLHAAGTTDTLGALLIVFGLIIKAGFSLVALKLLVIPLILMLTNPTASHALSRAVVHYRSRPWKKREENAHE